MSSMARKLKRTIERDEIKNKFGVKPEIKCPYCDKFTVFKRTRLTGRYKCVRCNEYVRVERGAVIK